MRRCIPRLFFGFGEDGGGAFGAALAEVVDAEVVAAGAAAAVAKTLALFSVIEKRDDHAGGEGGNNDGDGKDANEDGGFTPIEVGPEKTDYEEKHADEDDGEEDERKIGTCQAQWGAPSMLRVACRRVGIITSPKGHLI